MAIKSEQKDQADKTKRQGLVSRTFVFLFALPLTVLATLLFSVLVEWSLMGYCNDGTKSKVCQFSGFNKGMGVNHSKGMLQTEANYLNEHFKDSVVGVMPLKMAGNAVKWVDNNIFIPLGVKSYKKKRKNNTVIRGKDAELTLWDFIMSAYYICKVVILRVCVLLLSWPSYLLFGMVGFLTGLVERELRKYGAGRESSDRYELSRRFIVPSISLCFLLYLSWPNSINPAMIVVPFAAFFGYSLHLTASNYKKHF